MSEASLRLLEDARRRYQAGLRSRAARICRRIPEGDAYYPRALELLGTIRLEERAYREAAELLSAAARALPDKARIWKLLGDATGRLGRSPMAVLCLRRAAVLMPGAFATVRGLADLAPANKRKRLFRRCSILSPLDRNTHLQQGLDLRQAGRYAAAARCFRRVLALDPADADQTFRLANTLMDLQDIDGGAKFYLRTLRIAPGSGAARNNLGLIDFEKEEFESAEQWFRSASAAAPGLAEAWRNWTRALSKLERYADAVAPCRRGLVMEPENQAASGDMAALTQTRDWAKRAMALGPDTTEFCNTMAVAAARSPGRSGVWPWLHRSAIANPANPEVWFKLSSESSRTSDVDAVVRFGRRATFISDDYASARNNTAFALLSQERFREGWQIFTRRLETAEGRDIQRHFTIPQWRGEELDGRHLLLWGEQGIGDEVQYLTLLKHVLRRGPKVTVISEPRLRPLIRRSFPAVVVPEAAPASGETEDHYGADVHLAMGDLPHRLDLFCGGRAKPEPWIVPDPARVASLRSDLRARHAGKRLIGISWRSEAPKTGEQRTVRPELWSEIAHIPGNALISLQYSLREEDIQAFRNARIDVSADHGVDTLGDLDGLAALIAAMDMVISPANNTVHFAGAAGVPTWVMLTARPNWPWGLHRDDSLWYPETRTFRQETDGDWGPVLSSVADSLRAYGG
ncbi:tetratricopeptide repeat protein [Nisaea sp.]|uniref:tetratricopeptide repeat protein n=1 Tax=Nisaea sp. TaxID=2024842 RepID=UPI003B51607D